MTEHLVRVDHIEGFIREGKGVDICGLEGDVLYSYFFGVGGGVGQDYFRKVDGCDLAFGYVSCE